MVECGLNMYICGEDRSLVCLCSRILSESEIDARLVALSEREWGNVGSHFAPAVITWKKVHFKNLCLLSTKDGKRGGGIISFRAGETNKKMNTYEQHGSFWLITQLH